MNLKFKNRIALIGRMGSGKSEIAKHFVNSLNFKRVALGDALKEEIVNYGLIPGSIIEKSRDRKTLQDWGQHRRGEKERFVFKSKLFHNKNKVSDGVTNYINYQGKKLSLVTYNVDSYNMISKSFGECYLDYWIDLLMPNVKKLIAQGNYVINDDIRRQNELDAFKYMGFTTVKISVENDIRYKRLKIRDNQSDFDESIMNDISENEIDSLIADFDISNNGTIEETLSTLYQYIM